MKPDELAELLRTTYEQNAARLGLLTALQRAVPRSEGGDEPAEGGGGVVAELKAVLTNVIIMQTRLNEREAGLAGLVERAAEEGALTDVAVEPSVVERWVASVAEAHRHAEGQVP